jgi:hypothetical protein
MYFSMEDKFRTEILTQMPCSQFFIKSLIIYRSGLKRKHALFSNSLRKFRAKICFRIQRNVRVMQLAKNFVHTQKYLGKTETSPYNDTM